MRRIAIVLLLALLLPSATLAQSQPIEILLPPDMAADDRAAFVEALRALDTPLSVTDAPPEVPEHLDEETGFAVVIARFDDALRGVGDLAGAIATWWLSLAGGGLASLIAVIAIIIAPLGGVLAEWGAERLMRSWRRRCIEVSTTRFAPRLAAALGHFGIDLLARTAFAAGTLFIGWLLLPPTAGARLSLAVLVVALFKLRLFLALGRLLFAPHEARLRLIPLSDDDAVTVWRALLVALIATAVTGTLRDVLALSGAGLAGTAFLGLVHAAVLFAAAIYLFIRIAAPIRRLILAVTGEGEGWRAVAARRFAASWHLIFIGLAAIGVLTRAYSELALASDGLTSAATGPLLFLILLPFVLGGWNALIKDLVIRDAASSRRAVLGDVIRTLGQGILVLGTVALVARSWGANPFLGAAGGTEDRIAAALLEAVAALLVGWVLWHGLRVFLELEVPEDEEDDAVGEGMGKQGSRIATLMPVIRSFLFVTIVTISGITALAALGIQIAPLLAGAGVLGLAIGFGAQTLVTDVITGLFFLLEDAFRAGEYIETDAGKGVVEKISARSVRLRHHRGPLYTIPFSKMGNIVNHSRDWVKIKFELRVPFETDLEKVRKLIKKTGQAMLDDPTLGPLFLQPMKSQGAIAIEGANFVIGVKFLCRPGQQFLIRREAYSRIKQAFIANGIRLATPHVTVDSASRPSSEAGAAAAAATIGAPAATHEAGG